MIGLFRMIASWVVWIFTVGSVASLIHALSWSSYHPSMPTTTSTTGLSSNGRHSSHTTSVSSSSSLQFKRSDGGGSEQAHRPSKDDTNIFTRSWDAIVKKILPETTHAKITKSFQKHLEDSGNHYSLRLLQPKPSIKLFIASKLAKKIPALSAQSCEEIVQRAIEEGSVVIEINGTKVSNYISFLYKFIDMH